MRCYYKVCTVDVACFKNIKHAIVAPPIGHGIYQYQTQLQNDYKIKTVKNEINGYIEIKIYDERGVVIQITIILLFTIFT